MCKNEREKKVVRIYRCSICGEAGHGKRTCPRLPGNAAKQKKTMTLAQALSEDGTFSDEWTNSLRAQAMMETIRQVKISEVEDLQSLYTVPLKVDVTGCRLVM